MARTNRKLRYDNDWDEFEAQIALIAPAAPQSGESPAPSLPPLTSGTRGRSGMHLITVVAAGAAIALTYAFAGLGWALATAGIAVLVAALVGLGSWALDNTIAY